MVWSCVSVILVLMRHRQEESRILGHPHLHNECQATLGYIIRFPQVNE